MILLIHMSKSNLRYIGVQSVTALYLKKHVISKNKDANVAGVFRYAIDLYRIAPLVGLTYGKKAEEDKNSTDTLRIFTEPFQTKRA